MSSCSLVNCIIRQAESNASYQYKLPSSSSVVNCVGLNNNKLIFSNIVAASGNKYAELDIFQDGRLSDLTDEAKAAYLGTDGTPVGMYGGPVPFSGLTSYPRITKMNVASKTTADGKLSVDIEVGVAE